MADLRPFHPGEYITNKDGTYSTERSRTVVNPYGEYINVPSLWKDENGKTYDLGMIPDDDLADLASYYELKSKTPWQRYKTVDEAVAVAKKRSSEGGAFQGSGMLQPDTNEPPLGGLLGGLSQFGKKK